MLKNVQLRTSEKDDYKAVKEVAYALKKSKKFDGTKIFLCKQVAGIAVPKGEKQDPYVHSFTFVSNDKDELQKLADNFNKILFPNHEKDELLGVNVRKNTDNYEDVFESKKIKAEEFTEMKSIEEAVGKKIVYLLRIADEYQDLVAVCSSKEEAKKAASEYHSRYDGYEDNDKTDLIIYEWPFDIVEPEEKQLKSYRA